MKFRVVGVALLAACGGGGSASQDGTIGGHCYPNGTCNVSLTCSGGICVATGIDAAARADALPSVDAFFCDNDPLEPNDSLSAAYHTPVALVQSSVTLTGLSICPVGDKDVYQIDIAQTGQNFAASATFSSGAALSVSLLNAAGTAIASPTTSGSVVTASVANVPAGTYYAEVYSSTGENNYQLFVVATGP